MLPQQSPGWRVAGAAGPQPAAVVSPERVRSWTRGLADELRCEDDKQWVELLRALEELKCAAEAAQARTAVELDTSVRTAEAGAGVPVERRGRGVAGQVGLARRCSPYRARQLLGLAKVVDGELPYTAAAWRTGRICEWRAMVIARETAAVPLPVRRRIDYELAADVDRLGRMSDRQTAAEALRWAARLDPAGVAARRRHAESQRRVSVRPAPDTMTWLSALLPVADGVAVQAALARAADTARAAGDERTRGQVMADTLVERLTGRAAACHDITVNLVMTDRSLFGTSDEVARIPGHGVMPSGRARDLVATTLRNAGSDDPRVWIRRLFTDPAGQLVAMESASRLVPRALAEFITLRDQACRTPWCDAPIRHIDHITPVAEGGPTSAANGQGLCEACNYTKTALGWQARPLADRWGTETVTPTGHTHVTHPEPWRTGRPPTRAPATRKPPERQRPRYPAPPHPLSRLRPITQPG